MRERFNIFVLAVVLTLLLGTGCSKPKPPETEKTETAQSTEPAPAPVNPPAPVEATPPAPEPAPTPAPVEKPVEKTAEKPESLWDRLRSSETPPPVVAKEEPLRVYYQKDPIPETWVEAWTATSHVKVLQTRFIGGTTIPTDGDIYLFTPDLFAQILAGPGALHLEKDWARAGLDPMFTGQPFDVNNAQTRPWRWTPYLVYGLSSRTAPWKDRKLADLWGDPKALWPDELGLLTGLSLKDQKSSANPRKKEDWTGMYRSLETRFHDKLAPEAECWRKLQAGEIELTLLPASLRLSLPAEQTVSLAWGVPQNGTLVYFEQVAIAEHTKHKDPALSLLDYLLKMDQQKRLLAETGYFPVRIKPGTEIYQGGFNFPKKDWLDQSEFLMEPPQPPAPAETMTPASVPAAPVSPALVPEADATKTAPVSPAVSIPAASEKTPTATP